jgi:hypothetical protein
MIVIPMAGLSSRFKKAGYDVPKYMLTAHGKTLFTHSVESFQNYFTTQSFLFVALDVFDTKEFIEKECKQLGIKNYQIVILDSPTSGQAETVYQGLKLAKVEPNESLTIFNIDTFRPNFSYPIEFNIIHIDGYLETFIGSGSNWSNILPADEKLQTVALTAEKQEISEYCCTGLYYWRYCDDFCRIFESYQKQNVSEMQAGEYYIAPMYNDLINEEKDVRFSVIDKEDVVFCGVPNEYLDFIGMVDDLQR